MKRCWNDTDSWRNNSPSANLSIKNPAWFELEWNLTLRNEGSVTNRLNLLGQGAGFSERDYCYFTLSICPAILCGFSSLILLQIKGV